VEEFFSESSHDDWTLPILILSSLATWRHRSPTHTACQSVGPLGPPYVKRLWPVHTTDAKSKESSCSGFNVVPGQQRLDVWPWSESWNDVAEDVHVGA